jgi:hypothetical protein
LVSVIRGYLDALRHLRRSGTEKSTTLQEKNARDHPVDKPTSFT